MITVFNARINKKLNGNLSTTAQIRLRCLLLFISLCFSLLLPGQNPSGALDSLKQLLTATSTSAERSQLFNEISSSYNASNFDSSYHYAKLGQSAGITARDTPVIARALILQGLVHASKGETRLSIQKTEKALALALQTQDSVNIASAYNNLALEDLDIGNIKNALVQFQKSLDYTTDDTLGRVYTLNNIALLHADAGNQEAANRYIARALREAEASNDPLLVLEVYYNKGMAYMEDSTLQDSAVYYYSEARALARQVEDLFTEVMCLINLGILNRDRQKYERAENHLQTALALSHRHEYQEGILASTIELAELYIDNTDYLKAQAALSELSPQRIDILRERVYFHELKTRLLRETGQYQAALSEQDSFIFYKDSLSNVKQNRELVKQELAYEVEKKDRTHKILELEKRQAEQRAAGEQRVARFSIFLLLLLLALTLLMFQQRRRFSQKLERQVAQKTADLKAANKELEHSNRELERFTYIASHDLKEPLRNIISFTNLLERKERLWAGQKDTQIYFGHIKRSARQMYTLIQDVLAYAQVRDSQKASVLKRVDLNNILDQIEEALQPKLEELGAVLYRENLTFLIGTPHHFYVILKNLIENGLKYNESERPRVIVRQALENNRPCLLVIDNGIGIPDEFKPKVFDMFYRLHDRTQYEGTGLGLAIVHRLASSLNAAIKVSDRPGGGTIFTIQLAS